MIEIRYARGREVEISGSVRELGSAHQALVDLLALGKPAAGIQAAFGYDPSPFQAALHLLVFKLGDGKLRRYIVANRALVIEGAAESLDRFRDRFLFREDAPPGSSILCTYCEDHPFLDPSALPAAFVIR